MSAVYFTIQYKTRVMFVNKTNHFESNVTLKLLHIRDNFGFDGKNTYNQAKKLSSE